MAYTPQIYDSKKTLSDAWKGLAEKSGKLDLAGGFTALAGELPNQINDFREITDRSNLLDYTGQLDARVNSLWNTQYNSVDDVLQASKFSNLNAANYTDEAWTAGQVAGHVLGDAAKGASIGTQFMPGIGTVIGAIGGTVLGAGKAVVQKIHANNMLMDAKKAEDEASLNKARAILYGSQQAGFKKNLMQEFNSADMGGPLSHGTLWNDNVILVDNGGTHEQNPYGGVIMGFDEEGTPNMVEEGEVIYNDYVFSNRLKVPKAIRHKYKLRELGGPITYADAIKGSKQFKVLEEMPNDPIAKRTFEAFIGDMAMSQEELRQKDMMKQYNRMAKGGYLINKYSGKSTSSQQMYSGPFYGGTDWEGFLKWIEAFNERQRNSTNGTYRLKTEKGFLGDKYKTREELEASKEYQDYTNSILDAGLQRGKYSNNPVAKSLATQYLKSYVKSLPDKVKSKLFDENGELAEGWDKTYQHIRGQLLGSGHLSGNFDEMLKNYIQNTVNYAEANAKPLKINEYEPEVIEEGVEESIPSVKEPPGAKITVKDYAPLFGNIGNIAAALASKPDYTAVRRYEDYALSTPKATTHPIGDYMEFNPVPFDYLINRYNAKNLNTKRGLRDLSGGNFATTRGSYLASDYDLMNDIGEFGLNDLASNLQQKQTAKTFNRGTSQYNSEDAYKTMAIDFDTYGKGLQALMSGAKDRFAIDTGYGNALSSNISTATQNMYDWEKYQKTLNMIRNHPWYTERAKDAILSSSKGGLLTVKKRGRR